MRRLSEPDLRATIERHPHFPDALAVMVRVRATRLDSSWLVRPIAKGRVLELTVDAGEFLRDPDRFDGFAGRLRVRVLASSSLEIVRAAGVLRRIGAFVEFAPGAVGDAGVTLMLASLGVPVGLGPEPVDPGVLDRLTRYFLESPTLDTPIEPFFLVAASVGGADERTLPDHYRACPGSDIHVTADRRVSLSWSLAGRDLFFGALDDGLPKWRASDLWQKAASFEHGVFRDASPCSFCPHFRVCRGGYRLLDPDEDACAGWRSAFDAIRRTGCAVRASVARRRSA